jgi:hypothetical protein
VIRSAKEPAPWGASVASEDILEESDYWRGDIGDGTIVRRGKSIVGIELDHCDLDMELRKASGGRNCTEGKDEPR